MVCPSYFSGPPVVGVLMELDEGELEVGDAGGVDRILAAAGEVDLGVTRRHRDKVVDDRLDRGLAPQPVPKRMPPLGAGGGGAAEGRSTMSLRVEPMTAISSSYSFFGTLYFLRERGDEVASPCRVELGVGDGHLLHERASWPGLRTFSGPPVVGVDELDEELFEVGDAGGVDRILAATGEIDLGVTAAIATKSWTTALTAACGPAGSRAGCCPSRSGRTPRRCRLARSRR